VANAPGNSRPLILVADDEGDIVDLVTIVLERAGYAVIAALEGRRALELASQRLPVLCILDGTMPGLAGFEVLQAIRSEEATATVPVLILTATVDEEREIRRHGIEPDAFMKKPFEAEHLVREVARLVG
jgi:DNA-binding response OmpR family regulator